MKFFLAGKSLETVTQELTAGLGRLSLTDNFNSFLWEGVLQPGEEVGIPNKIVGQNGEKIIPKFFVIVDIIGPPCLTRGATAWDQEYVTLQNVGTNSTIGARVVFFGYDKSLSVINAESTGARVLEVDYTTPPAANDVPVFDGEKWTHSTFLSLLNTLLPIGTIIGYGGDSDPPAWMRCDGRELSRTTHSALFDVIGTLYGVGDGSTTFNIPDYRQRMMLGKADSGTGDTIGDTGGEIDHDHSVPAHYHGMGTGADLAVTITPNGNIYRGTTGTSQHDTNVGSDFKYETLAASVTGRIGLVTGGVDGNAAMSTGTQNPPFLVSNMIIYTGQVSGGGGQLMGILGLTYP